MTTQLARRPISKGICTFCKSELAKNKMTQHLKSCKQRIASIASEEEQPQEAKTRLFHILAEGQYNPQYWLHFELPASGSLRFIDGFLKTMWIEDLDHLSGFEINGTNYRDEYPDFYPSVELTETEEEEISEGEEKEEVRRVIEEILARHDEKVALYAEVLASYAEIIPVGDPLPPEWIAEIKKPRSLDELIKFLKEELARVTKEDRQIWKADRELSPQEQYARQRTLEDQKWVIEDLLLAIEDRSLDVSLGRVLQVGQKFSYVYDFGSSTYINLRVIAEREGIVQNKKKPVQLLAQNIVKTFPCVVCGKPATQVAMGYFLGDIDGSVYCDACAEKNDDEEFRALPIINSPRVGVL